MNCDGVNKSAASSSPEADLQAGGGISIVRIQMVREGIFPYSPNPVRNSSDAAKIFQSYLAGADREYFVILLLDAKHRVNALNVVSVGSLTCAIVQAREVFKPAVVSNAASVILSHNHPSNVVSPSPEDIALTKRLVQAGEVLGIKVLDHIIIGEERYMSFADRGMISTSAEER